MHPHRLSQTYDDAFRAFLNHTDEKRILFGEISQRIAEKNIKSLLDIGAGNGQLSIPLAQLAKRYLAVEARENYVQKLRNAGLEVCHAVFPCIINDRFNMVLASRSTPWRSEDYQPFIGAAWNNV